MRGAVPPTVYEPKRTLRWRYLILPLKKGSLAESFSNNRSPERQRSQEVVEVQSSMDPEESALIPALMERVREFGQARRRVQEQIVVAPVEGDGLREMLDEVSAQAPGGHVSSDDDCSSSTSGDEKCGVCERSFRHRGPVSKCVGCTKRVHRNYCVKYMKLSSNYRAGMCNVCCQQVEDWITEVKKSMQIPQVLCGTKKFG